MKRWACTSCHTSTSCIQQGWRKGEPLYRTLVHKACTGARYVPHFLRTKWQAHCCGFAVQSAAVISPNFFELRKAWRTWRGERVRIPEHHFRPRSKFAAVFPSAALSDLHASWKVEILTSVRGTAINHSCQRVVYLHITSCPVAFVIHTSRTFSCPILIRAEDTQNDDIHLWYNLRPPWRRLSWSSISRPQPIVKFGQLFPDTNFTFRGKSRVFFVNAGHIYSNSIAKYRAKDFYN